MKKTLFLLVTVACSYLFPADTVILLIRHGQTNWNRESRIQGQTDNPLNGQGVAQSKLLAEKILLQHPDIKAIYASDLERAYSTAEETAKKMDLEVIRRTALREIDFGEAEGLTFAEREARFGEQHKMLDRKYPDRKVRWNFTEIPGAETRNELLQRAKNEVTIIAQTHPGEKVAIFTHGGVIRSLVEDVLDEAYTRYLPNCGIVYLFYSSETTAQPFKFVKFEELLSDQF